MVLGLFVNSRKIVVNTSFSQGFLNFYSTILDVSPEIVICGDDMVNIIDLLPLYITERRIKLHFMELCKLCLLVLEKHLAFHIHNNIILIFKNFYVCYT